MPERSCTHRTRKKTDIATTLARRGGFRVTTICKALGVARSNISERKSRTVAEAKSHRQCNSRNDDVWLLPLIKQVTDVRPTYGYRRVTTMVNRVLRKADKPRVNHKRIYRIMHENNLSLQRHAARPTRNHNGKIITIRSNLRWCSDGFEIQCWNGEKVQVAFSLDCHDREVITWLTSSRGLDGSLVRDLISETVESRFGPVAKVPHKVQWLSDNGPGYVAYETIRFGRLLGLEMCTTAPYSPESNGMAEAFVKTFKRDYVSFGDLSSSAAVLEQLPKWFEDYNENGPHKGLGMRSPREYIREYQLAL